MGLYIGCPIWGSKRWVGSLFPSGSRSPDFLRLYSEKFPTVEGNTTFYAMPEVERILKWRKETPPGFRFCLKFPQAISHGVSLGSHGLELRAWIERLEALGDRGGPSFLQLPSQYSPGQFADLVAFLQTLPKQLRFAVEVRHPGFFLPPFEGKVDQLLSELGMARVLYDVRPLRSAKPYSLEVREALKQKPQVPVRFTQTTDFLFIRFISHPEVEKNTPFLEEWVNSLVPWLKAGLDVYFFVHHIDDFYMPALCQKLYERLSQEIGLPQNCLVQEPSAPLGQQELF